MGAAAHRLTGSAVPVRPALRLVPGTGPRPRRSASVQARGVFRVTAVCLLVIAVAGTLRVSLAASAAEATIEAWRLRAEVKAERLTERTLEADRSALAAPSRIEAVASQTLNMMRPVQVSYLQLPQAQTLPSESTGEQEPPGGGLLSALVGLAAEEAQVMLIGDVGLGSLR